MAEKVQQPQHHHHQVPVVVRDPRFVAGRKTVGETTSITIFATLLEEARTTYGIDHIETAPAYYEYGNALFRYAQRQKQRLLEPEEEDDEENVVASSDGTTVQQTSDGTTTTTSKPSSAREIAAAAAERRARAASQGISSVTATTVAAPSSILSDTNTTVTQRSKEDEKNGSAKDTRDNGKSIAQLKDDKQDEIDENNDDDDNNDGGENGDDDDDVQLALDMMETAWSILDEEQQQQQQQQATSGTNSYVEWICEQTPRVLTGIGDVLSDMGRHADATDAYLSALERRQKDLDQAMLQADSTTTTDKTSSSSHAALVKVLQCRRKVVEANILIVEELLACGNAEDVVTSESKVVLVKAGHVIEYARGYYDKARDELQEAVYLLGQLSATSNNTSLVETDEKENICFVATMVMGAGTALAELDEQQAAEAASTTTPSTKSSQLDDMPSKKKIKRK